MTRAKIFFEFFLLLSVWLIPWQTRWIFFSQPLNRQFWEYGQLSLYFTEICLILALFFWLLAKRQKRGSLVFNYHAKIKIGFFLAYLIIISIFAPQPNVAFYYLTLPVFAGLLFFLLSKIAVKKIIIVLTLSGLVQGLLAWWQFKAQYVAASTWLGMAEHWPGIAGTSVIEIGGRWLRAYGSLPHPNMLGGFLVVAILAGLYWWQVIYQTAQAQHWQHLKKNVWQLILVLIAMVVMTFGLLASFSRSALLALFAALIFDFLVSLIQKQKLKTVVLGKYLVILLLSAAVFNFLLPQAWSSRWQFDSRLENKSIQERADSWQQINWTKPGEILFGQGLGLNTWVNYRGGQTYVVQPIHNFWLLALAEVGLVGLILFLYLFWSTLKVHWRELDFSWLVVWLVIGLFDHYWWTSLTGWLILAVILVISRRGAKV